MICVILCGGKSTRLKQLKLKTPKALLSFNKETLISILIKNINPYFDNIIISYFGELEVYFQSLKKTLPKKIFQKLIFLEDTEQKGTAHCICSLSEHLSNEIITIMNGDTLFSSYTSLFPNKILQKNEVCFTICNQEVQNSSELILTSSEDFYFRQNRLGVSKEIKWINSGVITLGKDLISKIHPFNLKNSPSIVDVLIDQKIICKTLNYSSAKFIDFGTPNTYLKADELLKKLIDVR